MENQKFGIFYFGKDPFTGKVVEALFSKKGFRVVKANGSNADTHHGDVVLYDLPDLANERDDVSQVLLSYEPVASKHLKYWCKTPMNETNLENLLFYVQKGESLVAKEDGAFNYSTKKIDDFLGDDEESKREVVSEFLENLHTNYRLLETYALLNDLKKVQDVAHKMLSGSEYYEVESLNKRLKILEDEQSTYTQEELDQMVEEIYDQVVKLRSALIRQFF